MSSFELAMSRIWRGTRLKCPNCNASPLFRAYLKPVEKCANCDEKFGHIRADDAPPYITLMIAGHVVMPLALAQIQFYHPPLWVMFSIWIPVLMALILVLLPCTKGGMIGLMWHLQLDGTENHDDIPFYEDERDSS